MRRILLLSAVAVLALLAFLLFLPRGEELVVPHGRGSGPQENARRETAQETQTAPGRAASGSAPSSRPGRTAPEGGVLAGNVIASDGTPLAEAVADLCVAHAGSGTRLQSRCGPGGVFRFAGLPAGRLTLLAWAPGYLCEIPLETDFDPDAPPGPVTLSMTWTGLASLPVRFVLPSGEPYLGRIGEMGCSEHEKGFRRSLAFREGTRRGSYVVEGLSAGLTVILDPDPVEETLLVPSRKRILPEPGENPETVFQVFERPRISGRILDPSGAPSAGVAVWCSNEAETDWRRFMGTGQFRDAERTGEDGRFSMAWFEAGERYLTALKRDGERILMANGGPFRLACGETAETGDMVLEQVATWAGPCRLVCTLREGENGPPVAGAGGRFDLRGGSGWSSGEVVSDEQGRVVLEVRGPGDHSLLLEMEGYAPFRKDAIAFEEGRTYAFDVSLRASGAALRGRVEGVPPEVASRMIVRVESETEGQGFVFERETRPDAEGRFLFPKLLPGRYRVSLDDTGPFLPLSVPVALAVEAPGGEVRVLASGEVLALRPPRGAVVTGRVLYAGGSPARGHRVFAALEKEGSEPESFDLATWKLVWKKFDVETGTDGSFRLDGLPGGRYQVRTEEEGVSESVELPLGGTSEPLLFELGAAPPVETAAGTLRTRVRVFYPDGRPAPGSIIRYMDEFFEACWTADADETGCTDVEEEIRGGVTCLFAELPGHARSAFAWMRLAQLPRTVDLRLRVEAEISGRVVLPREGFSGEVMASASLWGQWPARTWSSKPDAEGRYRIAGLPPGMFEVHLGFEGNSHDDIGFGTASLRCVELSEGEKAVVDLDLGSMGRIVFDEPGEEAGAASRPVIWPQAPKAPVFPPYCPMPGFDFWFGPGIEQAVPPGTYAAGRALSFERAWVWILQEGVRVLPGKVAKAGAGFEPSGCGALHGSIEVKPGEGLLCRYGVFLWRKGVRVLVRPEGSGRIRFDRVPAGTYEAKLVWGTWWETVRELRSVTVEKGKVTDLGNLAGRGR